MKEEAPTHVETIIKDDFEYFLNQALAPFAILTGAEFVFTFANAAYVELMNGRELVGKSLDEAIPELKGQPFVKLLEKVYQTGMPYHASEIEATAKFSGADTPTTRYFNLSYTPYKNKDGVTEGVLASGYDITEQVELKKRESAQVLNLQAYSLFMQAPVGFCLLTGDDHIIQLINSTAQNHISKDQSVIGKSVVEVLPDVAKQGYLEILNKVKNSGENLHLRETPVAFKDGEKETVMYMNVVYQPYYNTAGEVEGVLIISTDVTEQVMARKNAEELTEQFETMANNIPNLAWIANVDGWIVWYNERWHEYTGTTLKDMEGWGWQSVHDPESLPAVMERWQASINSGEPFEMVFPLKGADNIFRPFLTEVVPIRDSNNKIIRWLGTNTDITKQKELERMKDDFLSITSHELKTPVTTIKAYGQIAESMLAKKGDLETLAMIKKMGTQVDKLTTLIEELLDITKIHQGKLIYKESIFEFNALIKEVIDDMQRTSTTHQILHNTEGVFDIYGDRNKLSQVLNNLISNAIKYSPDADKIIVSVTEKEEGVELCVQDFGIGISEKEQKHIFEQFYRVNGDSQSTFPGMGIGLYICYEIIKKHHGKIWVSSSPGKGTSLFVWLPLQKKIVV